MKTKICIVGCGAIGGTLAGHLAAREDIEVYVYDIKRDHANAIVQEGLQISGCMNRTLRLHVASKADDVPVCDFGIIATKSMHTRSAIEASRHAFQDARGVCSVQNGLGNEEVLSEYVPNVIRGATFVSGRLLSPGRVQYEGRGDTWIGPFEPSGTPYTSVMELATLLNAAGVKTIPMQNARGAQWTKLIFNAAVNPIGALTRLSYRASIELPFTKQLCEALVSEGEAVAGALGIPLLCDPHDLIQEGLRTSGQHEVSMLQDVRTQALTEIDFINGMIADIGRRNGVPTPLHRTMHQLIKGLEESWERAGYQLQTQGFRAGESEM